MKARRNQNAPRRDNARRELAFEAARLMAEQGIDDPLAARRKALQGGIHGVAPQVLPEAVEILECLRERLALLHADDHAHTLARLRGLAVEAMRLLDPFSPRLVGAVLDGSAVDTSPVVIHLLGTTVEEVVRHLLERGIRYRLEDVTVRYSERHVTTCPALRLDRPEGTVRLVIFSPDDPPQPPLDPRTGARQARARCSRVSALLAESRGGSDRG